MSRPELRGAAERGERVLRARPAGAPVRDDERPHASAHRRAPRHAVNRLDGARLTSSSARDASTPAVPWPTRRADGCAPPRRGPRAAARRRGRELPPRGGRAGVVTATGTSARPRRCGRDANRSRASGGDDARASRTALARYLASLAALEPGRARRDDRRTSRPGRRLDGDRAPPPPPGRGRPAAARRPAVGRAAGPGTRGPRHRAGHGVRHRPARDDARLPRGDRGRVAAGARRLARSTSAPAPGILALALARLGVPRVVALDVDPTVLPLARANLARERRRRTSRSSSARARGRARALRPRRREPARRRGDRRGHRAGSAVGGGGCLVVSGLLDTQVGPRRSRRIPPGGSPHAATSIPGPH